MEWIHVLTILGGNLALIGVMIGTTIAMFKWARAEASEDRREMLQMIRNIESEVAELKRANDAFIFRLLRMEEKS